MTEEKSEAVSLTWKGLPAKNELLAKARPMLELAVDDTTANDISKFCKEVDKFCKSVKNERLAYTRKLDDLKKQYMEQEKALTAELLAAKETLQKRVSDFLTEKERARQEAERERARLEAEAAMARQEAEEKTSLAAMFGLADDQPPAAEVQPMPMPPKVEKTKVDGVRQVKVARWNITDASKLPREFLSVDESKIRAFANDKLRAGIDLKAIQIDGIEFYEEISAQLR